MKKPFKTLAILFVSLILLFSCEKEAILDSSSMQKNTNSIVLKQNPKNLRYNNGLNYNILGPNEECTQSDGSYNALFSVTNQTSSTINNISMGIYVQSNMNIISSSQSLSNGNDNHKIWNIGSINAYGSRYLYLTVKFNNSSDIEGVIGTYWYGVDSNMSNADGTLKNLINRLNSGGNSVCNGN